MAKIKPEGPDPVFFYPGSLLRMIKKVVRDYHGLLFLNSYLVFKKSTLGQWSDELKIQRNYRCSKRTLDLVGGLITFYRVTGKGIVRAVGIFSPLTRRLLMGDAVALLKPGMTPEFEQFDNVLAHQPDEPKFN